MAFKPGTINPGRPVVTPQLPQQVGNMAKTAATGGFNMRNAGPQLQSFSPQQNLIGTQINPVGSQRGQAAAGMTDRAANAVSGYQFSPFVSQQANTSQSQSIYDQLLKQAMTPVNYGGGGGGGAQLNAQLQPLLDKVLNAPDRGQIAGDLYGVLEERAKPQFDQRLRSVGQKAAALGRVGAGLTTSELGDVELLHNRDLDLSRRQLAAEGAQNTLSDRLAQLGAAKDVYGAVSSANSGWANAAAQMDDARFNRLLTLGRDVYGQESDAYGRGVGERDAALGYDQTRFGNERSRLGDMSIYEQDIYGRDRNARDELRDERGYQYGLERDALGDRERQFGMEQDLYDRDFNRAMQVADFGYRTNPAAAKNAAAAAKGSQAQSALDQFGPMFLEWARRPRPGQGGGSGAAAAPAPPYGQVPDGYSPF